MISQEAIEAALEAYAEGVYLTDEQVRASVIRIVEAALPFLPIAGEVKAKADIIEIREALGYEEIACYPDFVGAVSTALDELERLRPPQASSALQTAIYRLCVMEDSPNLKEGEKALIREWISEARSCLPSCAVGHRQRCVPLDATPAMIAAALAVDWSNDDEEGAAHNIWHAMVAASPKQEPASTAQEVEAVKYEARICKGVPADCCDYGVVDLEEGIEVCRVWKEADVRLIADLLNGTVWPEPTEDGDDLTECFRHHVRTAIGWQAFGARPGHEMQMYEEGFKAGYRRCQSDNEPEFGEEEDALDARARKVIGRLRDSLKAGGVEQIDIDNAVDLIIDQAKALTRPQPASTALVERLKERGQAFANQVRLITHLLHGQAYSTTVAELNAFDAALSASTSREGER